MTINERVSPKRLAEIIARAEVCDDSVLTDYRDIESIARELQQYRAAAEPVCPKCGGTGMADSGGFQPWGEPIFIECDCHAAPQLPLPAVVPDAIEIDDDFDSAFEHGKAVGWNAYRAAMLQGGNHTEQNLDMVNSPVIPDGWQLVPIDPTKDMLRAGQSVVGFWLNTVHCYSKMLAAAPAAPQQEAE